MYPDIIAYYSGRAIVIENKRTYDVADIAKMNKMKSDKESSELITEHIVSFCRNNTITIPEKLDIHWGHGYSGQKSDKVMQDMCLFYVQSDGQIIVNDYCDRLLS